MYRHEILTELPNDDRNDDPMMDYSNHWSKLVKNIGGANPNFRGECGKN